jgi:hypothetical protein
MEARLATPPGGLLARGWCSRGSGEEDVAVPEHTFRGPVTALYYDGEHEEIYTGNSEGFVHMWSS